MPLKQGSNAPVTKLPFQTQDKPALGTARYYSLLTATNSDSALLSAINRYSLSIPLQKMPGLISKKGSNGKRQISGTWLSLAVIHKNITYIKNRICLLSRVHTKGVVLCERACFCSITPPPSKNPSKNLCLY